MELPTPKYPTKYTTSEHFNENPYTEIDAALVANSPESVRTTLETRLITESRNEDEKRRINEQLAYIVSLTGTVEIAA